MAAAPPDQASVDAAQDAKIAAMEVALSALQGVDGTAASAQIAALEAEIEVLKRAAGLTPPPPPAPVPCSSCTPRIECAVCGGPIGGDGLAAPKGNVNLVDASTGDLVRSVADPRSVLGE